MKMTDFFDPREFNRRSKKPSKKKKNIVFKNPGRVTNFSRDR